MFVNSFLTLAEPKKVKEPDLITLLNKRRGNKVIRSNKKIIFCTKVNTIAQQQALRNKFMKRYEVEMKDKMFARW